MFRYLQREEKYLKIKNKISELDLANRERRKSFFEMEKELREKQDKLNQLKNDYNSVRIDLAKFEVRREDLRAEIISELGSDEICRDAVNNSSVEKAMNQHFYRNDIEETKFKINFLLFSLEQFNKMTEMGLYSREKKLLFQ